MAQQTLDPTGNESFGLHVAKLKSMFDWTVGGSTPVSLTAGTTQTLAGSTKLSPLTIVSAANANDGVALPKATGSGAVYFVITVGSAQTAKVWPQAADKIDGGSAAAAVTLTAAHRAALFIDTTSGNWMSFLLGAVAS